VLVELPVLVVAHRLQHRAHSFRAGRSTTGGAVSPRCVRWIRRVALRSLVLAGAGHGPRATAVPANLGWLHGGAAAGAGARIALVRAARSRYRPGLRDSERGARKSLGDAISRAPACGNSWRVS